MSPILISFPDGSPVMSNDMLFFLPIIVPIVPYVNEPSLVPIVPDLAPDTP